MLRECEKIGSESGDYVAGAACAVLLDRSHSASPAIRSRPAFYVGTALPDILMRKALGTACRVAFETACLKSSLTVATTNDGLADCHDRLDGADQDSWRDHVDMFYDQAQLACAEQASRSAPQAPRPPAKLPPTDEIVSQGRPTFQSTTAFGGLSSRAVDGSTNANYGGNSCTHTGFSESDQGTPNPWWAVDLGATRKITRIKVTNRRDCCSERLNNFEVRVGDVKPLGDGSMDNSVANPLCSSGVIVGRGATREITCLGTGRYVTLRLAGQGKILTLCEVQVFAEVDRGVSVENEILLSRSKPTFQSSTGYGGVSNRAVDGNKRGVYGGGSCTHTLQTANPWWAVDLGAQQRVARIRVTNRSDCCAERLSNFEIRVGNARPSGKGRQNTVCKAGASVPRGQTFEFECQGVGRFVSIRIPGANKILTLCEVEVLA